MTQTNTVKTIRATGSGVPPAADEEPGRAVEITQGSYDSADNIGDRAKDYWRANVMPQGRLMAVRAARLDGMRRLVERIAGAQVNSRTLVKDFVTQSDQINSLTEAMLKGAREQSVTYHDNEPVVEVEMSVTMETVWQTVKTWSEEHYKGDKVKLKEFEERTQNVQKQVITETGMGCVAEKYMKEAAPTDVIATATEAHGWPTALSETGSAVIDKEKYKLPGQARLMAQRAAEIDARRKLAEKIDSLQIRPHTCVKDFVAEHGSIQTAIAVFQQGAYVVEGSLKENADGTVEITVSIDTQPLWETIIRYERTTVTKVHHGDE